ncbi:hypothetical protein ACPEH7_07780 [Stenotrophomonas sp. NPDC101269]|uniref:hypothetical protein n=1 Tax=Stenotrophomonas TaxID=40323 RepID=UPI0012920C4F|nr:hypothetical protein [Stenotrophomonas nematodicola]
MSQDNEIPFRLTQIAQKRLTADQLAEVRRRLEERPEDADFNAVEAAIYVGRSTKTLKRAIDAGVGPARAKNPDASGLYATNRHTRYRKGDLDAWRSSLISFAIAFKRFDDLTLDAPWIVTNEGKLWGHILDAESVDAVLRALSDDAVVFATLNEALREAWSNMPARRAYEAVFDDLVEHERAAIKAAGERDAIHSEFGM